MNPSKQTPSAADAGSIQLGDLTVHRLGYGAMRITGKGIWGEPADRAAALATLRRAVELGVNFIDTADSYGPYVSEEIIAEALAPYPQGVVIATKGGWERVGPAQWTHNASPKHLESAVEGSLKRLRLDRIDVYQLHIPDPAVSFDASMNTLARLREQGKIRHVALSNVTLEHLERARKIVPIVSVQNRYSFADREWDYLLNHCAENKIVFIPWAPAWTKSTGTRNSRSSCSDASARLLCRLRSHGCCAGRPLCCQFQELRPLFTLKKIWLPRRSNCRMPSSRNCPHFNHRRRVFAANQINCCLELR